MSKKHEKLHVETLDAIAEQMEIEGYPSSANKPEKLKSVLTEFTVTKEVAVEAESDFSAEQILNAVEWRLKGGTSVEARRWVHDLLAKVRAGDTEGAKADVEAWDR